MNRQSIDTKEKYIQLRAEGRSLSFISKELNRSKPTLIELDRELRQDITLRKKIELEALTEKYMLSVEARIKNFGKIMEGISKEISKRDIKDVPTDKLYELYLKFNTGIKEIIPAETPASKEEEVEVYQPPKITVNISQEAIDKLNLK